MLLGSITIVLVSWYRASVAGTLAVDGNGLTGAPALLVFSAFLAGLGIYSFGLYQLWKQAIYDAEYIRIFAWLLAAIYSLMLPMLSNDFFSLITYGDASNRGIDVYTDVMHFSRSPFFTYVGPLWRTAPCVYGPVSLNMAKLAAWVGHGQIGLALLAYKAISLLWAGLFIEVSYRLVVQKGLPVQQFILVALNPVFLIQGLAQLHCDLIAVSLAACLIYFLFSRKWRLAFVFLGISVCAKMNFILLAGYLIIWLFLIQKNWVSFLLQVFSGIFITTVIIAVLYLPFYTSAQTFTRPFRFLMDQPPAKSLAEVLGDIVYFAPSVLSGHHEELNNNVGGQKVLSVSNSQLKAWLLVKKISQLFAMLLGIFIFLRFLVQKPDSRQWMRVFLRLLLVFLLFYSHIFYAWYLMIVLLFIWYENDLRFLQWLFVMTCFSNVHDIMCAVQRGTPIYFLVLPLTLAGVLLFFWRLKNNFFTSLMNRYQDAI